MAVEGEVQLISDLDKEMKVEKQRDGNDNKCEHCDKVLSRKRAMRLHVKRVHLKIKEEIKTENQSDGKNINCEHCEKAFTRRLHLELHTKRVHLKIRDHICEICKKPFSTMNDLNTHRIVHQERKFACNICGLKIRSKVSLVNHMESRHMGISKKPYFCQDCGIQYSNTSHRRMHMDQSKLEKYTCDTCGKQFGFNKNLKRHEKIHAVEGKEVVYSNNFKLEVLEKSEEIGIEKMAKLVGLKESTIKGWGRDEGHQVVHQPLQVKKEVVAFALAKSVAEAEKEYNIEESTIRSWIKKLKNFEAMEDADFAPRKDYVQKKYSAQVFNFELSSSSDPPGFLFVLNFKEEN